MSGGTRSFEMARRLVARGHEVHMITTSRDSSNKNANWFLTNESGILVHWLPVPYSNHLPYLKRILAFAKFAIFSRRRVIDLGGDLILASSTPLTVALPSVLASKKLGVPMVFEVRDLWPELPIAIGAIKNPIFKFLARALEKWAYNNSSAVVVLSPGMKQGVIDSGYPAEHVAVIPNSCDNDMFSYDPDAGRMFRRARTWLQDRPLIVYTGTFGLINGVEYLLYLAKRLSVISPDVRVLLVGDGRERDCLLEKAAELGVLNVNLFVEPAIRKSEVPGLMSAATLATSLFIDLPEMRNNSANKFFDALASGKPVLINYGGWMHDLIHKHQCGINAWRRPLNEVASEVATRLQDREWLEEASRNAKNLAEKQFDRDVLAVQLESVLISVISSAPRKAAAIAPGEY